MSALPITALLAAVAILTTAGCDNSRADNRKAYVPAVAKLEQSIELPGNQGTVHVLRVPTGYLETTRCVVVTSPAGSPAVSCTPKDFEVPPDDSR